MEKYDLQTTKKASNTLELNTTIQTSTSITQKQPINHLTTHPPNKKTKIIFPTQSFIYYI
jgi:hypothetical protein